MFRLPNLNRAVACFVQALPPAADSANTEKVTLRCNLTCHARGSMIGFNRNRMLHGP